MVYRVYLPEDRVPEERLIPVVHVPEEDYGYPIEFDLHDHDRSTPTYHTGFTVWDDDGQIVNASCASAVYTASTAITRIEYMISSGDFSTPTTYFADLDFTKTGTVQRTRRFIVVVYPSGV